MHPDLLKILSHSDQPIDNEKLIAYLTGQLSPAESQQVEEQLAASGIDEEALDGLMMLNRHKVSGYQQELDLFLKKQIKTDKRRKHKPLGISWGWLAAGTAAIILLAILAWYFIHALQSH
jgi:anti-sigma factor RsiW